MESRVLVVDDEKDICDILQFNLENAGYIVDIANSGEEALKLLTDVHQLIILDVMMDGISGFKMAQKLRNRGNYTPIIFLTAKNSENDVLTGFSMGGDDYISKPFSVKEVIARVGALIKRTSLVKEPLETIWRFEGLVINLRTNRVSIDDIEISLTKKEFEILWTLTSNKNQVFSRESLLNKIWGYDYFGDNRTVDSHIKRLRAKLDDYSHSKWDIKTIWGVGYKFEATQDV